MLIRPPKESLKNLMHRKFYAEIPAPYNNFAQSYTATQVVKLCNLPLLPPV